MNLIDLHPHTATSSPRRVSDISSGQRSANNLLGWVLLAAVALSTLIFGGVHGFTQGLLAAGIGLAALVYGISLARHGEMLRVPLSRLKLPGLLFVVFCGYLLVQALPLGLLTGPMVIARDTGTTVESLTISIASDATWLMLLRQVTYGLFFFLMLQVAVNDGRRRLLQRALLLVTLGYAMLALVSLQFGDSVLGVPKSAYLGSATGPFVNRNSFATFLAMGAMIALAQGCRQIVNQLERHPHDGRVQGTASATMLFGLAYLLLMTVIVATQSRAGLLVACLGSGVVIAAAATIVLSARRALVMAGMAVLALAAALLLFGGDLLERALTTDSTAEVRTSLYAQVLELIMLRPFSGFGGGAFELAFPLVHRPPVDPAMIWDKAHNTYLTLWSEFGFIAGSLPILIYAWAGFRLVAALARRTGHWPAQAIALAALLLSAVHSLVDFSLEIPANTFLLLALIASGLATTFQSRTR